MQLLRSRSAKSAHIISTNERKWKAFGRSTGGCPTVSDVSSSRQLLRLRASADHGAMRSMRDCGVLASTSRMHRGDIMSPAKRSALMARIRGRDTGPERAIATLLIEAGLRFECHARDLPGRPDFVFRPERVVVMVDGDFWHGWRFPVWRDKLSPAWEAKIEANRRRDARNRRRLRTQGWTVIRLWEHQIDRNPGACLLRVRQALRRRRPRLSLAAS